MKYSKQSVSNLGVTFKRLRISKISLYVREGTYLKVDFIVFSFSCT
jgi:hypothetical protein